MIKIKGVHIWLLPFLLAIALSATLVFAQEALETVDPVETATTTPVDVIPFEPQKDLFDRIMAESASTSVTYSQAKERVLKQDDLKEITQRLDSIIFLLSQIKNK